MIGNFSNSTGPSVTDCRFSPTIALKVNCRQSQTDCTKEPPLSELPPNCCMHANERALGFSKSPKGLAWYMGYPFPHTSSSSSSAAGGSDLLSISTMEGTVKVNVYKSGCLCLFAVSPAVHLAVHLIHLFGRQYIHTNTIATDQVVHRNQ